MRCVLNAMIIATIAASRPWSPRGVPMPMRVRNDLQRRLAGGDLLLPRALTAIGFSDATEPEIPHDASRREPIEEIPIEP